MGKVTAAADRHRALLLPLAIFLLCAVVYSLLHIAYTSRTDVFTTDGDEVHYLVSTESLIDDHDLSPLNNYMQHVYMRNDYYQQEIVVPMIVPGAGGRMVSNHLPLMPLILVPGFWLFGYNGAAATMILLFSLAAVFVFFVLRRFARDWIAALVTLFFFLSYPAVTYSRLIYPETVAVFLLSLGIWASFRLKESGALGYAVAVGIAAGLMFQLHTKFVVLTIALAFLAWSFSRNRKRDSIAWLIPVAASLVILLIMTRYLYGPDLWHGLTVSAGPGDVLGGEPFWGFFGLYLDRAWGLFIFAPFYFLFIPGIPLARGKKDLDKWWIFIPLVILLQTGIAGFFGQWHGGSSPVPRYLVPLIPVFVLCALVFFVNCKSKVARAVMALLLIFQSVITVFALIYPMNVFAIHGESNTLIPKILGDNWLSDIVVRIFPLLHPVRIKSGLIPLVVWILLLLGMSLYMRRKVMDPIYPGLSLSGGTV